MSSSARSSSTSVTACADCCASSASGSRALILMIGVPLKVWTLISAQLADAALAPRRASAPDVAASAYTGTTASEMPKKISPWSASVGLSAIVEVDSYTGVDEPQRARPRRLTSATVVPRIVHLRRHSTPINSLRSTALRLVSVRRSGWTTIAPAYDGSDSHPGAARVPAAALGRPAPRPRSRAFARPGAVPARARLPARVGPVGRARGERGRAPRDLAGTRATPGRSAQTSRRWFGSSAGADVVHGHSCEGGVPRPPCGCG